LREILIRSAEYPQQMIEICARRRTSYKHVTRYLRIVEWKYYTGLGQVSSA